jgi:putative ABC transport system ATP-binding protein
VDLRLDAGEHIAIIGSSGSGKSTLLHVLGLIDEPDAGSYRYDGVETTDLDQSARAGLRNREVGIVFQSFHLLGDERASENVALPLLYGGVPRKERRRRAAEALDRVGLADRADHRPSELSGGERQRVAIARAIVRQPRLILADEPTGNLDTQTGLEILNLFSALHAEGLSLLVITHDPQVAGRAQRVLRMSDGALQDMTRLP